MNDRGLQKGKYVESTGEKKGIDSEGSVPVRVNMDKLENWLTGLALRVRQDERSRHWWHMPTSVLIGVAIPLFTGTPQVFLGISADVWQGLLIALALFAAYKFFESLFHHRKKKKADTRTDDKSEVRRCIEMMKKDEMYDILHESDR